MEATLRHERLVAISGISTFSGNWPLISKLLKRLARNRPLRIVDRTPTLTPTLVDANVEPASSDQRLESIIRSAHRCGEAIVVIGGIRLIATQSTLRRRCRFIFLNPPIPTVFTDPVTRTTRGDYVIRSTPSVYPEQSYLAKLTGQPVLPISNRKEADAKMRALMMSIAELMGIKQKPASPRLHLIDAPRAQWPIGLVASRIARQESYFFKPRDIFLTASELRQLIEELTHYLKFRYCEFASGRSPADLFLAEALHEAAAYLIVRLHGCCLELPTERHLITTTIPPRQQILRNALRLSPLSVEFEFVIGILDPTERTALAHLIGYRVGKQLFYRLKRNRIRHSTIRKVLFMKNVRPKDAYQRLVNR